MFLFEVFPSGEETMETGITDVCIFHKSGVCLLHVSLTPYNGGMDSNLIAGFLSAVAQFGKEVEKSEIKQIEFEGRKVVYCSSGDILFAVRTDVSSQNSNIQKILEEVSRRFVTRYNKHLENWDGDIKVYSPFQKEVLKIIRKYESPPEEEKLSQKLENINQKLDELRDTPGIRAAALVDYHGFVIASNLPPSIDERIISAISASIEKMSSKGLSELKLGKAKNIYVEGENGFLVLTDAAGKGVLTILASTYANLGYIFLEAERVAKELEKIL